MRNGIKIDSAFDARIEAVGALVNGNPILSIAPNEDYVIDMVSGNYIVNHTGNMVKGNPSIFAFTPSCISEFNDWILKSIDDVEQV